jgi:hypothetical protein
VLALEAAVVSLRVNNGMVSRALSLERERLVAFQNFSVTAKSPRSSDVRPPAACYPVAVATAHECSVSIKKCQLPLSSTVSTLTQTVVTQSPLERERTGTSPITLITGHT